MIKRLFITKPNIPVFIVLVSIIIIGIIGIPFGDPRFIIYAVLLESSYIILAVFVAKGFKIPLYACIFLAVFIIVGNSFVTAHIHRIMTLSRPLNTMVLIIGGYILQILLIYTSIVAMRFSNRSKSY
ncbi:MAG: hypothetical protein ABJB76_08185 [Candidatus Nitrosocosmicus sp.]